MLGLKSLKSITISSLPLFCILALSIQAQSQQEPVKTKENLDWLTKAQSIGIDFVGNRIFSDEVLIEQMWLLKDANHTGKLRAIVGSRYATGAGYLYVLEKEMEWVRFFLGTKGYLQAQIGKPKVENVDGQARITIPVQEGARFKIGEISVKDAKVISSQEIIEISGLVSGEVIDASLIQDKVYKGLKEAYSDRGYIQASIDFIPNFRLIDPLAHEGIVDVMLEVSEGRMFLIRKVSFLGNFSERVSANKQMLLDCLLLKDADVYNRRLLLESAKNLNRLGWFESIENEDLVLRTNDREQAVDVDIVLREKRSSPPQ